MQWTAAGNRVDWIPSDSTLDDRGLGAQLVAGLPRDFARGPSAVEMVLPPMPIPEALRGQSVTAAFIIDERGKIERLTLRALDDRTYTRKLMTELRRMNFRPAIKSDGTPTKGYYLLTWRLGP
jgi:hypothetical protein